MARGVNKVILVGNCGQDPETRYTPDGMAITTLSLATSESWKDKQTGQQQDRTEWHRVVFYGRIAEIAGEYIGKGSQVYVEGKLRTRKWEKDGVERYTTEIVVDLQGMMQLLGGNRQGEGQGQPPAKGGQQSPRSAPKRRPAQQPAGQQPYPTQDDLDDDLPF